MEEDSLWVKLYSPIIEGMSEALGKAWNEKAILLEALQRAVQLAQIASDWDLGSDGEVEIDDEWVSCHTLRDEFEAAIAKATE